MIRSLLRFVVLQAAKAPRSRRYGAWSRRTLTIWSTFLLAASFIVAYSRRVIQWVYCVAGQSMGWFSSSNGSQVRSQQDQLFRIQGSTTSFLQNRYVLLITLENMQRGSSGVGKQKQTKKQIISKLQDNEISKSIPEKNCILCVSCFYLPASQFMHVCFPTCIWLNIVTAEVHCKSKSLLYKDVLVPIWTRTNV